MALYAADGRDPKLATCSCRTLPPTPEVTDGLIRGVTQDRCPIKREATQAIDLFLCDHVFE
jgi:hypothetical protein